MPKSKRSRLKRIIAQADIHSQEALYRIKEMHDMFAPVHPEHAIILEKAAGGLFYTRDLLRAFWTKSWGKCPEDMSIYLSSPPKKGL